MDSNYFISQGVSRGTDDIVMRAIDAISLTYRDAVRIWNNPTNGELRFINIFICTESDNSLDEIFWADVKVSTVMSNIEKL